MSWAQGEVVVWREVWRGTEYIAVPVRVVADCPDLLAVYVAEGTRYSFPNRWPFGEHHPWAARGEWVGAGTLILARPGDGFAICHFWEDDSRFKGWYVNLQEPFRRQARSYLTQDQELDIWIEPDGTWRWEDEQELLDWVPRGRFTEDEVAAIRAEGERVLAEWPFPTGWEEWTPDPAWTAPELPTDA